MGVRLSMPLVIRALLPTTLAALVGLSSCASSVDELGPGDNVERAQSLVVGWSWACTLSSDNRVACWGYVNGDNVATPTYVPELAGSVMLASSYPRVCGLKPAGELVCVLAGASEDQRHEPSRQQLDFEVSQMSLSESGVLVLLGVDGQVRSERVRPADPDRKMFVVQNLPRIRSLGSGGTCGVADTGSFWCWQSYQEELVATEVSIPGEIQSFVQINDVAFALMTNGEVWSIPAGDYAADRVTRKVHTFAGATHIDSSVFRACVVHTDGVSCWGLDYSTGDGIGHGSHKLVEASAGAVDVGVGLNHGCLRTHDAALKCWGSNGRGQLGLGTLGDKLVASAKPVLEAANEIATGSGTSCASTADGMYCWGRNPEGQLGLPTKDVYGTPTLVPGTDGLSRLALGWDTGCGLRDTEVVCWGHNAQGAVGIAGADVVANPTLVPGMDRVEQIHVVAQRACALREGTLWCWGRDSESRFLRAGGAQRAQEPVELAVQQGDVTDAFLGERHTCALDSSATLWCWGGNRDGQIGGPANEILSPTVVGRNVEQVIVARQHTCFRAAGDSFVCRGPRSVTLASILNQLPVVEDVFLGTNTSCARTNEGSVWCWDQESTTADRVLDGVVAFDQDSHRCWIDAGRNVSCAGTSFYGQLGDAEHWSAKAATVLQSIEP